MVVAGGTIAERLIFLAACGWQSARSSTSIAAAA
jgi:hypothetical protein